MHPQEIEIREISSINEVLNIVKDIRQKHPTANITTAFDWDETISYNDAQERPLREDNTSKVIETLVKKFEVDPFILTSRFNGYNLRELAENGFDAQGLVYSIRKRMHDALPILKRTPHFRTEGEIKQFKITDENGSNTVMMLNGVIFAGSHTETKSVKGKFLQTFVKCSIKPLDYLLFIDNDMKSILSAKEALANHPERLKIILLYYPKTEESIIYSLQEIKVAKPETLRSLSDFAKDKLMKYDRLLTFEQREAIFVR